MDVCLLLTRCKSSLAYASSNLTIIFYRIFIGKTMFLEHLQDGLVGYSLGQDKARVQIPPGFLRGQPQHTNFLVQIWNWMYRSGHILVLPDPTLHLKTNATYHPSHHLRHGNLVLLCHRVYLVLIWGLLVLVLMSHMPIPLLSIISIRITTNLRRCPLQALLVQIPVREGMVMEAMFLLLRHI